MRRETATALLTVVSVLLGCNPDPPKDERRIATVRDSAGIRIVESPSPLWAPPDAWTIDPAPVRVIGGAEFDPTRVLYGVRGALILDDRRTVIANAGTLEVLWFDPDGALEHVVGGPGDGPGEFRAMYDLFRCRGDSIVVKSIRSLSVFDPNGHFVRGKPILAHPGDGYLAFEGVAEDCSTIMIGSRDPDVFAKANIAHQETTLYWTSLDDDSRDTITAVEGGEAARLSDGNIISVPWGFRGIWAVGPDRVYVGSSEHFEIRVYDLTATLNQIIRWEGKPRPVTADDHRLYAEKRKERIRTDPNAPRYVKPLDEVPTRSTKPTYSRFLVDDENNLWVREYPTTVVGIPFVYADDPTDEPEVWTVFDPLGQMLGVVTLPSGLDLQSIRDGIVVGVWKDEFDVEQVRMYRLRKNDTD